jgi:hypothetical protein
MSLIFTDFFHHKASKTRLRQDYGEAGTKKIKSLDTDLHRINTDINFSKSMGP